MGGGGETRISDDFNGQWLDGSQPHQALAVSLHLTKFGDIKLQQLTFRTVHGEKNANFVYINKNSFRVVVHRDQTL